MWQLKAEFLVDLVFDFVPGFPTVLGLPLELCALNFIRNNGLSLEKLMRQVYVLGFVSLYWLPRASAEQRFPCLQILVVHFGF